MANSARDIFPARITGNNGGGDYSWIEQVVGQAGDYEDSPTPRTGTTTISKANEANGITDIPDDTIVMLKLRGVIAGNPIYDIICSAEVFGSGTPVYLSSWWLEGLTPTSKIENSIVFQDTAADPADGCIRAVLPCIRFHTGQTFGQILVSGNYDPIDLASEQPTPLVNDYLGQIDQTLYLLYGNATIESITIGGNEFPGQLLIISVSANNGSDTITLTNRSSSLGSGQGEFYNGGGLSDSAFDVVLGSGHHAVYLYSYTAFPYGAWFLLSHGGAPVPSGLLGTIDGGTW